MTAALAIAVAISGTYALLAALPSGAGDWRVFDWLGLHEAGDDDA